jgi:hypothetical protein
MGLILCLSDGSPAFGQADQDDPTRPVTSVELRPHFEDNTVNTPSDRLTLVLRGNVKWRLPGDWQLAMRGDLPLAYSNTVTDENPAGQFREGVGRPLLSAYTAHILDDRWAIAVGSQLVAPASGSVFGSGNWEAVPLLAARYMLPELGPGSYFVPQFRYVASFAQSFAGKSTSNFQFSPQLKLVLPENWYFIMFPSTDIRINFGEKVSGQTGRLFLPLDLMIGRDLGHATVASLEVSVPVIDAYPVYRTKIEARISAQL